MKSGMKLLCTVAGLAGAFISGAALGIIVCRCARRSARFLPCGPNDKTETEMNCNDE